MQEEVKNKKVGENEREKRKAEVRAEVGSEIKSSAVFQAVLGVGLMAYDIYSVVSHFARRNTFFS